MRSFRHRGNTLAWQIAICLVVLAIWQWGYDLHKKLPWLVPDLLDPYFVSKPSDIFEHFLILSCLKSKLGAFYGWFNGDIGKCLARNDNNLLIATAVTLTIVFAKALCRNSDMQEFTGQIRFLAATTFVVWCAIAVAGCS